MQGIDPTGEFISIIGITAGIGTALYLRSKYDSNVMRVGAGLAGALLGYAAISWLKLGYHYAALGLWNSPEWNMGGDRPQFDDNTTLETWEENAYRELMKHVVPGKNVKQGNQVINREQAEAGARKIANAYVSVVQEMLIENNTLSDYGDGLFGTGGYWASGWGGDLFGGYICKTYAQRVYKKLEMDAPELVRSGWFVDLAYNNRGFGDSSYYTWHAFVVVSFNKVEAFTNSSYQPDVALDPWPHARPDVYDGKKNYKYWRPATNFLGL